MKERKKNHHIYTFEKWKKGDKKIVTLKRIPCNGVDHLSLYQYTKMITNAIPHHGSLILPNIMPSNHITLEQHIDFAALTR